MSGQVPGPLDLRERYADEIETIQTHLDGRQAQIHTAMPGHIVSFNPATMTASVQLGIQGMHKQIDGTTVPMTIVPITDVPVHFPSGGGHTLTFPVKAGDECLVVFAERSIDNWHQHGGTQQPSDYRMHDLNDCFVQVGVRSQPNVLSNFSPTTTQLRSDDGTCVIDLNGPGGTLTITVPNGITFNAPFLHVSGAIIAGYGGGDQIGVQTHTHTQGTDSHGDSESPTHAPTAGT